MALPPSALSKPCAQRKPFLAEPQFRLRLSLIDGPELRCPHCGDWWPISTEFWRLNKWDMCRSCERERARLYARMKSKDPEFRSYKAAASKHYRLYLKKNAPQYLPAYERERRAQRREYQRLRRQRLRDNVA